METEQFNIRLPSDLVQDLNMVSKLLKVNKSEWVKTKLAEEIYEEKSRLLMELSNLYVKGMITKKEIEFLVGKGIAEQMESIYLSAKNSIAKGVKYGNQLKRAIHS